MYNHIYEGFSRHQTSYRLLSTKSNLSNIKIKIKDNAVDLTNTRMYINPFCEIAMQEAANLK
jgi:electron transfer flavoprotein alpha/beta subunit